MEETSKKQRGGARKGAGRKAIQGRDMAVTFRVSALAKERLAAYAAAHGISQQEAVNRILEALQG